jgi:hypothetical protein
VWRPKSTFGRMWRGFIGGALAYGMALELILSGLVVVSSITLLSAAQAAEHCLTLSGDDAPASPGDRHALCRCGPACTITGCAAIVGGIQTKAALAWLTAGTSQPAHLAPRAILPPAMAEGPHSPRAPPRLNPPIV